MSPTTLKLMTLGLLLVFVGFQNEIAAQTTPVKSAESASKPVNLEEDESPPTPRTIQSKAKPKKQKLDFKKNGAVVYRKFADQELKCDVYIPEGEGPFPAVLAVHGGAWRQGTKFALLRHAWKMAQSGYVVVAINYRHAPKHPFPAQIHDCKHAVRWMRSNAAKYKINPDKICGFGYSAGGHLVSLLGTSDKDDGLEGEIEPGLEKFDTRLVAVAAGGAPCEFSWIDDDSRVIAYWLGGSPNEKPDNYRAASPTNYITADDPPFFLFHGSSDLIVPQRTSKTMHDKLLETGVESSYAIAQSYGHLGTFSDLTWMDKAIEFFDKHVKD